MKGPTSFNYLRTVQNTVHISFEEACRALGLLMDDKQWEQTLREACLLTNACQLRQLFVIIVVHCCASNPLELWELFRDEMSDDIRYRMEQTVQSPVEFNEEIFNMSLLDVQEKLHFASNGKTMTDYGLPTPHVNTCIPVCQEYFAATNYNSENLKRIINNAEPKLNREQQNTYNTVLNDIEQGLGNTYYLDAPGGTGTVFLLINNSQ